MPSYRFRIERERHGRFETIEAPSSQAASQILSLAPGEEVLQIEEDGVVIFDPFGGVF